MLGAAVVTVMAESEKQLVAAAKRGSSMALGAIFDRHWENVWRAAYAVTRQRESANDAAQDAFVRAASALGRFDEERALAPWLARIAVNRAIDLVRAERRATALGAAEPSTVKSVGGHRDLYDAVAALPLERRAVIVLHFLLGFTFRETAEILDIPPGTVASRVSRALTELRQTLEAEEHV